MIRKAHFLAPLLLSLLLAATTAATATAAEPEVAIAIRNHKFEPAEVRVPANTKVRLVISNEDATAEEFESKELKREKVIPPNAKGVVLVGPLKPGRYPFFGEFHEATAKGVLVAE